MEEQRVNKKVDKKPLFAIMGIALIGVVAGTFAYFTSSLVFNNKFKVASYNTVTTEEFVSPDNWTPGTVTPKSIVTKNDGNIPIAVRVSYTEEWKDKNGTVINNVLDNAVKIDLDNTSLWTKSGDYFYYNKAVKPNESTLSFIKSVTLNKSLDDNYECSTSSDGKSKKCTSKLSGLEGGTYTLSITTETVQYDQYDSIWTDSINITE